MTLPNTGPVDSTRTAGVQLDLWKYEFGLTPGGAVVEPRVQVITLAVDDLERAPAFYRDGLGFKSDGIIGTEWEARSSSRSSSRSAS